MCKEPKSKNESSSLFSNCTALVSVLLILLLLLSSTSSLFTNIIYLLNQGKDQQEQFQQALGQTTATSTVPAADSELLIYENTTYGIKIKYPYDWSYYGSSESSGVLDIVVFQAPLEGRTDPASAFFIVSTDTLTDRIQSLEDYADRIIDNLKVSMPDFELVESQIDGITLAGRPAYKIVNTNVQDNITYKTMEIGTIIGNKVYLITYDAEEAEYFRYLPIIQKMIDSFGFINNIPGGSKFETNMTDANMTAEDIPSEYYTDEVTVGGNATDATSSDQNNVDPLLNEADDLRNLGRYDEAIKLFDRALAIDPNNVDALSRKAYVFVELGQYEEAIENYDKALAIDPDNIYTVLDKANTLRDSGRYDEAIEYFDKAILIDPTYIFALNGKAAVLSDLGRYEEAITYYDKALTIDPNDTQSFRDKGLVFRDLGRYDEAIKLFDRALAIDPNYIDVYNDKAIVLENLGRYQEAIEYYDKALAIDPTWIFALNNKGLALDNLGKYEEAITYFDKVLAIDPNDVDALNNKGVALKNLGKYEEAITYFDKVLAIDPNAVSTLNNKGVALDNLGRYDEAIAQYDKALEIKPIENIQHSSKDLKIESDYYISVSQTMDFVDFDRYKEFNGLLYIALSKDSENTIIIIVNKGIAQYKAGRYTEANDNFETVLKMDKNYAAGLYYKGLCLEKLGQPNQAISYKNRAAAIDPTYKGKLIDISLIKSPLEQLFDTK